MHALPENPNIDITYNSDTLRSICLAGGCFWGVQAYIARLPGVSDTVCGYANGRIKRPTYEQVCAGDTGFAEAVMVSFDPGVLACATLIHEFFGIIDPTAIDRQGGDRGPQYRTGIYYTDAADRAVAEAYITARRADYALPIVVEVAPLCNFFPAEDYHQNYLDKNPGGYCHVNMSLLSQRRWAHPGEAALRSKLTTLQYAVTQCDATEKPFTSPLAQQWEDGIYVDIVTGQPLFCSLDQFDAGCGWPSFAKPITAHALRSLPDHSGGRERVEVRSVGGDSHLGHVFTDGPEDMGGLRYCINGAALRFVPRGRLKAEGYGEYVGLWG